MGILHIKVGSFSLGFRDLSRFEGDSEGVKLKDIDILLDCNTFSLEMSTKLLDILLKFMDLQLKMKDIHSFLGLEQAKLMDIQLILKPLQPKLKYIPFISMDIRAILVHFKAIMFIFLCISHRNLRCLCDIST